jgi:hypothetical protein
VDKQPGKDELNALCAFSTSRGKGMFSLFHKQLLRSAQGAESGGEYKGKKIVMLKDAPPVEPSSEESAGKDQKKATPDKSVPSEDQPGLLRLSRATTYPWVTCFDTTLLEAATLEGLKRGIDLATDPAGGFAGAGHIKAAYEGFSKDPEVIGAVSGEPGLARDAVTALLSFIGGETPEDVRARVQWPEIERLNGWVDIAEADRAHLSMTITCADEKAAQALHSALAAEFEILRDGKKIEGLSHATDGASTTFAFDVGDLDNLPRKEKEPKEESTGEDTNGPADTQPDGDH